jgi:uncharacterized protein (UPF0216 family)
MPTDREPDEAIAGYLSDELKTVNAHLPRARKSLAELMKEAHPHVLCNDGHKHHFKKKELKYLCELLPEEDCPLLLLPIIMEVQSEQGDIVIHSKQGIEAKILAAIIGMTLLNEDNTIRMFKPQVNAVRSVLKTTTQYVFRP